MNNSLIKDCAKEHNKVIFMDGTLFKELDVNEDIRKQLLVIDKYVEYSFNTYDSECKAYTIYHINEKMIDKNNNLILLGQCEYINE